ncbi:protocatechuate 3,4-dioxygenase [Arthrobacter sp. NPDC055585]
MPSHTPRIEGTHVYDTRSSSRGRALNKMLFSLKHAENRDRFTADESAYCDEYKLNEEQKQAVLDRDWTTMTEIGASIFYVVKLAAVDRKSVQDLGAAFTGMSTEEFIAALRAGGRKFG